MEKTFKMMTCEKCTGKSESEIQGIKDECVLTSVKFRCNFEHSKVEMACEIV